MNKTKDFSIILGIGIVIIFLAFTGFYLFSTSKINDNNTKSLESNNIYSDINITENIGTNDITNLEKTIVELSSYTTKIYDTDKNRIYNIKLAWKQLNGHKVLVGEEFSFNNKLGNMGEAEGYKKSIGFDSNGNKIKMYGGGICQISSTLYNAVLIANLKVTERHAHSRRVYYVPKNKDATVYAGGPDFKFINNSDSDIIINASTDGYTVTVTLTQEKIVEKK